MHYTRLKHNHTPTYLILILNKVIDDANQWLWASMWCTLCNTLIVTSLSHNLLCFIFLVGSSRQPRFTSTLNGRGGTTSVLASFLCLECPLQCCCWRGGLPGNNILHTNIKHALCSCVLDFHGLCEVRGEAPADGRKDNLHFLSTYEVPNCDKIGYVSLLKEF